MWLTQKAVCQKANQFFKVSEVSLWFAGLVVSVMPSSQTYRGFCFKPFQAEVALTDTDGPFVPSLNKL